MSSTIEPKIERIINLGAFARMRPRANRPTAKKTPKTTVERAERNAPSKISRRYSTSGFVAPAMLHASGREEGQGRGSVGGRVRREREDGPCLRSLHLTEEEDLVAGLQRRRHGRAAPGPAEQLSHDEGCRGEEEDLDGEHGRQHDGDDAAEEGRLAEDLERRLLEHEDRAAEEDEDRPDEDLAVAPGGPAVRGRDKGRRRVVERIWREGGEEGCRGKSVSRRCRREREGRRRRPRRRRGRPAHR